MNNIISQNSAEMYFKFLEQFQKRVSLRPLGSNQFRIQLSRDLPGLSNLISSFSATAFFDGQKKLKMEWNPFSQRPYLRLFDIKDKSIFSHFDRAVQVIDSFIVLSHEASHILLWEPFFTGSCQKISRDQFVDASHMFEGFCFWYADIIVTRSLRTKLPDGEFANARGAVSQSYFHPYRAFKSIGVTKKREILDIYLKAFVGRETKLYKMRQKPFVADLFERCGYFYRESTKLSKLYYDQLYAMDVFTCFNDRFCKVKGLPSLLQNSNYKIDSEDDILKYCQMVAKSGFKHISTLSEAQIARIRMRRFIQTRAYAAYTLLYAIRSRSVFSRKKNKINYSKIELELNNYIDSLETLIMGLCTDTKLNHLKRLAVRIDNNYAKKIRSVFKLNDIWVSKRLMILPILKTRKRTFGFITEKDDVSISDIQILTSTLINQFCFNRINQIVKKKAKSVQMIAQKSNVLLDALTKCKINMSKKNIASWKSAFNDLLMEPDILEAWSMPLSSINPTKNLFRDALFIYE